jgi:hypothetical protein
MEDDLNFFQMQNDLNILANGRQPRIFSNGIHCSFQMKLTLKKMQPKRIKYNTMVVAPLQVTFLTFKFLNLLFDKNIPNNCDVFSKILFRQLFY